MYVHVHMHMHVHVHVHVHVRAYVCKCANVYMHVQIHVHMHVHVIYVPTYTFLHVILKSAYVLALFGLIRFQICCFSVKNVSSAVMYHYLVLLAVMHKGWETQKRHKLCVHALTTAIFDPETTNTTH
jgi:hypothetical protein